MSIVARGEQPRTLARKHEFESSQEWGVFLQERYLAGLEPGQPFLLIANRIDYDHSGRRHPEEKLETRYYLGELAAELPLTGMTGKKEGENPLALALAVTVATTRYCCYPPRDAKELALGGSEYGTGDIQFKYFDFYETPLREAFRPPYLFDIPLSGMEELFETGVMPFELAVGFEAIEQLRAKEAGHAIPDFAKWFVRSCQHLGFPLLSEEARDALAQEKREIILGLLDSRARLAGLDQEIRFVMGSVGKFINRGGALTCITDETFARLQTSNARDEIKRIRNEIKDLFDLGRNLGMHEDTEWLLVDGLSYQPARILQDFEAVFPA